MEKFFWKKRGKHEECVDTVVVVWYQLIKTDRGSHWRQANVETAPFYTNKEVDHLIKEIEVLLLLFTNKESVVS